MLKLTHNYQQEITNKMQGIAFKEKYKYWNNSCYWDYSYSPDNDSWNNIQYVSVDKEDNVIGYLTASISRSNEMISGIGIINFYNINMTFSKDLHKFLFDLFLVHNFRKIQFEVIIGNPAEKMYDRIISKYGGKIIGVSEKCIKLHDNRYYDKKYYEIFKEDFLRRSNECIK